MSERVAGAKLRADLSVALTSSHFLLRPHAFSLPVRHFWEYYHYEETFLYMSIGVAKKRGRHGVEMALANRGESRKKKSMKNKTAP